MQMETMDFNSSSDKESQTSNPPPTLRNQVSFEAGFTRVSQRHALRFSEKPALRVYSAISQKGEYINFYNEWNWKLG